MTDAFDPDAGKAKLYLVATPIGNLNEMSPRALAVLKAVDVIACEDTRTSGVLLKHFSIQKKRIAYHKFNEEQSAAGILALLREGKSVALISDAGYPLINDPGQLLVSAVVCAGIEVVPISGPNAAVDALVASGLTVQPYAFIGFLPQSGTERRKKLKEYESLSMTLIFYEAPHRIEKMLTDALHILGDRPCCIGRELTKIHEEFLRGTIAEVLEAVKGRKGEMVVIIAGAQKKAASPSLAEGLALVQKKIASGARMSAAVKEAAAETGIARNILYDLVQEKRNEA